MDFGWINLLGAIIVVLIMVPNVVFASKWQGRIGAAGGEPERGGAGEAAPGAGEAVPKAGEAVPKYLSVCEQVGRYGCIVLMWLPLFVWKFGFGSVGEFVAYAVLNGALLVAYYVLWAAYAKGRSLGKGMALAIIPTTIFLLSGLLLRHWSLVVFAVLFGFAHGKITYLTHRDLRI